MADETPVVESDETPTERIVSKRSNLQLVVAIILGTAFFGIGLYQLLSSPEAAEHKFLLFGYIIISALFVLANSLILMTRLQQKSE